tara:strand:+ start:195 stop:797 length:603 start_codon:yes stop_codon:yes gene_type:complete
MECVICLGDISDSEKANTKCGHSFHTACLMENLATGPSGFKCPMCRTEMCSEPCQGLKEDNIHQGDYIERLEGEIDYQDDCILYLYDQADCYLEESLKGVAEKKYMAKKISKLEKTLKRSQSKLSSALFDLNLITENDKPPVKCSRCNFMGHNKKTCQINPIKEEFINPFVSQQQLRDKEDILDDLREGELSKLVVDHFE